MQTNITNTPDNVNTQSEDRAETAWVDLLDSLPAEVHARMCTLPMLRDPAWRAVEEREQAEAMKATPADKASALRWHVEHLNTKGTEDASWGALMLGAVAGFDADMVRGLLQAGARAEHLYADPEGDVWSIASRALFEFTHRAQLFDNAAQLWAQRCADIVAMTVQAGGPRWVSVWLGVEVQPVLDLLRVQGIELRGTESWQVLGEELECKDGEALDSADALCMLLDARGMLLGHSRAFECGAAQYRFDAAFGAWFDNVVGSGLA